MKKYNFKNIHIGQLICNLVSVRDIDEKRIVNFFNDEFLNLEEVYASKSLDSDQLLKWSKLLGYDLFRVYSQHLLLYSAVGTSTSNNVANKTTDKIPSFKKNIYTTEIIEFIISLLVNNEKSVSEIISDYKIPKTTLYRWIKKYDI